MGQWAHLAPQRGPAFKHLRKIIHPVRVSVEYDLLVEDLSIDKGVPRAVVQHAIFLICTIVPPSSS